MTRDEMKELACLGFSADLVMQSFCHTAAYPKPVDLKTHAELPDFMASRGGVALRPGDGIIHSWLNRMLLPDTVGTGGDSHTRFPLGISFPAGSGLVAFAAAIGAMPLDMPESVLVKFSGSLQPGRDPARCGERHSLRGDPAGPAHGGQGGQEKCVQRPDHGDRGAARPQAGAGV
jgi:aconitate hydratase 2 / 2-methylisocitrate dehydratase